MGMAKRWTLSKWGKQDVLMDNGVMSSLTLEETCEKLNELEALKADAIENSLPKRCLKGYNNTALCTERCDGIRKCQSC